MSVLESLRKRSGLLVAIVGLALLAFVLTGLFERGNSMFGGSDRTVGEIAGKSIDYNAFNAKVQEAIENQKRNSGKTSLTQEETDQAIQQVWNQTINEEVLTKEYEKLGIAVSDEELYDLMVDHPHPALIRNLSDPQTGKVSQMFADEKTGQISPAKIKAFTQAMTDEQEGQWAQLEKYIRQLRIIEKYNNIIKKGLYVSTAVSKRDYIAKSTMVNFKYVMKNYNVVADSTIKTTEADLNTYYTAHQNDYKQEASRKIEYVSFDIAPSSEDAEEAKADMQKLAEEFKTKKSTEDSSFVIAESDVRDFDMSYHTKGTLSPEIDTMMFKAETGTVMGPYLENGSFKVSKLIGVKTSADSAHVRHILIAYKGAAQAPPNVIRTKEQAKKMADSLRDVLKSKKGKFEDYVEQLSDDGGKKSPEVKKGEKANGSKGDYGWINANSGFVEPFKNAGLDNKKGDLVVVESDFGYHIVEVVDAKGAQKKVQVVSIEKKLEPSSKTLQAIFVKASAFSGKNTTNDLFQKSVIDEKLNKRIADNVKENDKTIAGIDSPRQLVRWIYENKKGTVSEPMEFGNKFIVASITEVREKGIAPLEQVMAEVTEKVIKEKKAEQFATEFTAAMTGGATIEVIAAKMNLSVVEAPNMNFASVAIPGASNEPVLIGASSVQKANTLSKPLKGREGVFLVFVETVKDAVAQQDYKSQQQSLIQEMQPRVEYEVYEALKDRANVVEHLVKFY